MCESVPAYFGPEKVESINRIAPGKDITSKIILTDTSSPTIASQIDVTHRKPAIKNASTEQSLSPAICRSWCILNLTAKPRKNQVKPCNKITSQACRGRMVFSSLSFSLKIQIPNPRWTNPKQPLRKAAEFSIVEKHRDCWGNKIFIADALYMKINNKKNKRMMSIEMTKIWLRHELGQMMARNLELHIFPILLEHTEFPQKTTQRLSPMLYLLAFTKL